jgi:hypothetical protein
VSWKIHTPKNLFIRTVGYPTETRTGFFDSIACICCVATTQSCSVASPRFASGFHFLRILFCYHFWSDTVNSIVHVRRSWIARAKPCSHVPIRYASSSILSLGTTELSHHVFCHSYPLNPQPRSRCRHCIMINYARQSLRLADSIFRTPFTWEKVRSLILI